MKVSKIGKLMVAIAKICQIKSYQDLLLIYLAVKKILEKKINWEKCYLLSF